MSDQTLDLRRSLQLARRQKILVATFAALGLAAGVAFTVLRPAIQVNEARQNVSAIRGKIRNLLTQPPSPARRIQLSNLRTQEDQANGARQQLQQTADGTRADSQALTTAQVTGSVVLNAAAPLPHSRFKHLVLYPLVGGILGLVLGPGIGSSAPSVGPPSPSATSSYVRHAAPLDGESRPTSQPSA
jgi:hypothetical protein